MAATIRTYVVKFSDIVTYRETDAHIVRAVSEEEALQLVHAGEGQQVEELSSAEEIRRETNSAVPDSVIVLPGAGINFTA